MRLLRSPTPERASGVLRRMTRGALEGLFIGGGFSIYVALLSAIRGPQALGRYGLTVGIAIRLYLLLGIFLGAAVGVAKPFAAKGTWARATVGAVIGGIALSLLALPMEDSSSEWLRWLPLSAGLGVLAGGWVGLLED